MTAAAAVLRVGLAVDASAITIEEIRGAGRDAVPLRADGRGRRTDLAAPAAVAGIDLLVDAEVSASGVPGGAPRQADPCLASQAWAAGVVAAPAIAVVALGIDADAVAELLWRGAARGALALVTQRGLRRAEDAAAAAVARVGQGVDALLSAEFVSAGAAAGALAADLAGGAGACAGATIVGVVGKVDAGARAIGEAREAALGANALGANAPIAAVAAAAAIVGVAREVDAARWPTAARDLVDRAEVGRGGAGTIGADGAAQTRVVADSAVRVVGLRIRALPIAEQEWGRAAGVRELLGAEAVLAVEGAAAVWTAAAGSADRRAAAPVHC